MKPPPFLKVWLEIQSPPAERGGGGAHYGVWCPVGPVLPHEENEGVSLALVGCPSSDGVTVKMSYGVDVLHQPASHPIFSYWVG